MCVFFACIGYFASLSIVAVQWPSWYHCTVLTNLVQFSIIESSLERSN